MNIMGMGLLEVAVVLLVAFLVLGPGRTIDMARKSAKMLGDLRRTFADVTGAMSVEQQQHTAGPPPGVPVRPDLPDDDGAGGNSPDSAGEPDTPESSISSGPAEEPKG